MLWPDTHKPALVLTGPSGTGKTEGILALLTARYAPQSVLRATERNTLREINSKTRLILLDDINIRGFTREEAIHLFETRQAGSLRILHRAVELPAQVNRVWVSNHFLPYKFLPLEIKRRIFRIHWPLSWYGLEDDQAVGELPAPVFIWSEGQLYEATFFLYEHCGEGYSEIPRHYSVAYLESVALDKEGQLREYFSQNHIHSVAGFKSDILKGSGFIRTKISTEADSLGELFTRSIGFPNEKQLSLADKAILTSLYRPFYDIIGENWAAVAGGVTSTGHQSLENILDQLPKEARIFDPEAMFLDKTKF
jgi:hypothetical protein